MGSVSVGRNKRSVWTIATAPYPALHFATFPPKLIEPMILAGTSERGCCPECGAPWERDFADKGGWDDTRWLVATELNLVNRLHEECKEQGKNVHFMSPTLCMCSTMFRTDPASVQMMPFCPHSATVTFFNTGCTVQGMPLYLL